MTTHTSARFPRLTLGDNEIGPYEAFLCAILAQACHDLHCNRNARGSGEAPGDRYQYYAEAVTFFAYPSADLDWFCAMLGLNAEYVRSLALTWKGFP